MSSVPDAQPLTVIEPRSGFVRPDVGAVWRQRDILRFLVKRDVAVRYKQTLVGAAWTVLRPALLAVVFSVFLGLLLDAPSNGVPYPAFVFASMAMWLFFSEALAKSAESTTTNPELISKIYFPRLILPTAAVLPPLVDLGVAFGVVVVVNLFYGITPDLHILLLPLVVLFALAVALGAGLWLSALAVRFRDVQLVVPFLLMILLFSGAVFYPLDTVPDTLQVLYSINPLVSIMEGYRFAMFPGSDDPGLLVLVVIPAFVSVLLLVTGLLYFARVEPYFADVI